MKQVMQYYHWHQLSLRSQIKIGLRNHVIVLGSQIYTLPSREQSVFCLSDEFRLPLSWKDDTNQVKYHSAIALKLGAQWHQSPTQLAQGLQQGWNMVQDAHSGSDCDHPLTKWTSLHFSESGWITVTVGDRGLLQWLEQGAIAVRQDGLPPLIPPVSMPASLWKVQYVYARCQVLLDKTSGDGSESQFLSALSADAQGGLGIAAAIAPQAPHLLQTWIQITDAMADLVEPLNRVGAISGSQHSPSAEAIAAQVLSLANQLCDRFLTFEAHCCLHHPQLSPEERQGRRFLIQQTQTLLQWMMDDVGWVLARSL